MKIVVCGSLTFIDEMKRAHPHYEEICGSHAVVLNGDLDKLKEFV